MQIEPGIKGTTYSQKKILALTSALLAFSYAGLLFEGFISPEGPSRMNDDTLEELPPIKKYR